MRKLFIWTISVIISLGAAVFQRITGPTYPESFTINEDNKVIRIHLPASHSSSSDKQVRISDTDNLIQGFIVYRRFPTSQPWDTIIMQHEGEYLTGYLPAQPPAGKLEYFVFLKLNQEIKQVNPKPVIIRFKADVPVYFLIPHILLIFAAMFFSNLAGFLAICKYPRYKTYAWITLALITTGGLILGPVIQKFAFGDFWTGFPLGKDLTDNKIVIAFIFWLVAITLNWKKERRWMIFVAAIIYFVINFIPHSLLGSELDYETGDVVTGMIINKGLF